MNFFASFWHRFAFGSLLFAFFWPILWYFKIGEIFGPKSFFWIIGELNYPVAALVYTLTDITIKDYFKKPVLVFFVSVVVTAAFMLFFYPAAGYSMGVLLQAILF